MPNALGGSFRGPVRALSGFHTHGLCCSGSVLAGLKEVSGVNTPQAALDMPSELLMRIPHTPLVIPKP